MAADFRRKLLPAELRRVQLSDHEEEFYSSDIHEVDSSRSSWRCGGVVPSRCQRRGTPSTFRMTSAIVASATAGLQSLFGGYEEKSRG